MRFGFSIKSSTHYIAFLRRLIGVIDKMRAGLRIDRGAKAKLALALVEAVNNAVFHAHGRDETCWIDIEIGLGREAVVMKVADTGKGFVMTEDAIPPIESDHGRGLFIIRSLMHKVDYKKGRRNVMRMVYYF